MLWRHVILLRLIKIPSSHYEYIQMQHSSIIVSNINKQTRSVHIPQHKQVIYILKELVDQIWILAFVHNDIIWYLELKCCFIDVYVPDWYTFWKYLLTWLLNVCTASWILHSFSKYCPKTPTEHNWNWQLIFVIRNYEFMWQTGINDIWLLACHGKVHWDMDLLCHD